MNGVENVNRNARSARILVSLDRSVSMNVVLGVGADSPKGDAVCSFIAKTSLFPLR
ncbi:MAG: hypothetical protein QOJ51_3107 [Acidobacteriaceae bacterium]|jgi:hypothetical protein|nr:hypothetical protein [Acidobacteriaceae bacterium]